MHLFGKRFFTTVNVKNMQELKAALGKGSALVDFYASWCGPCKLLTPVLERVVQTNTGIQLIKVDIDESGELATQYQVSSVPTVLLFDSDGKQVKSFVGARDEKFVRDFIKVQ